MDVEANKSVNLRNNRVPRDFPRIGPVGEQLLTESSSGIERGEDDDSTSADVSFSSPDLVSDLNGNNNKSLIFNPSRIVVVSGGDDEGSTLTRADILPKSSITSSQRTNTKIPDGGWGWIVVLSSFVISMIADGISFSFGLLYIEFLEEFEASKSTTAWIGSLFIAVPLLSGPVMSALVDRYGCRSMTILGGIISTLGFVLASISTTLEMMMITFGVIAGLGLGLVYVTAVVSIAFWFDKKRNLATGLGACGTGVGTFLYAPMTQYFIEEYGWRGTILLLSGTLLNLCVCGCVMRDPEWWILEQKQQEKRDEDSDIGEEVTPQKYTRCASDDWSPAINTYIDEFQERKKYLLKKLRPEMSNVEEKVMDFEKKPFKYFRNHLVQFGRSNSLPEIHTYLEYSNVISATWMTMLMMEAANAGFGVMKCPEFIKRSDSDNRKLSSDSNNPPVVTYPKRILKRSRSENFDGHREGEKILRKLYQVKNSYRHADFCDNDSFDIWYKDKKKDKKELVKQDSKGDKRDWLKKQLSINHHYLKDLKMTKNSISHRNAMLNINYKLKASSCPDIYKNSMITIIEKEERWYESCASCCSDMFNVTLLKKPTFNVLCLSTILLFVWFIVPYFYLAEHMIHKGYSEDDGAVMLSLIGITNTIGMVGLGYIGDIPGIEISRVYSYCLILCGASVASIPAAVVNYWILATASSSFGLMFAASYTFIPSLLVKIVSLDDFTSAYGLVLLAQGIGHLIGPPLSGYIFDVTLSWDLAFYLAGGWIVVSGMLVYLIKPLTRIRREQENDNEA